MNVLDYGELRVPVYPPLSVRVSRRAESSHLPISDEWWVTFRRQSVRRWLCECGYVIHASTAAEVGVRCSDHVKVAHLGMK